jgi:hypothetical protein
MTLFEQGFLFWYWLALGLILTLLLGLLTPRFLKYVDKQVQIDLPKDFDSETWKKIFKVPGKKSAARIAILERTLFFFAFWSGHPELILGWLVIRVAAKWDSWANITKVPTKLKPASEHDWLIARKNWAARTMQRFVGGQLLNVLWAALGVTVYVILAELSSICLGLKSSELTRYIACK